MRFQNCLFFQHVILQHKGFFYKLDVYDAANQILFPTTLEHQIEWIMEDAKKHVGMYWWHIPLIVYISFVLEMGQQ